MKRPLLIMGLSLILMVPQAWGQTAKYPNPYRQTMWNNLTDTIHTLGQSPTQAAATKMRLRNTRTDVRIHDINQAKRQAWLNSKN